jgi:hypothetical protein
MISTVWAVVREGKVVPLENIELPEGARALVTLLPDETEEFWLRASESALDAVWDNAEDDCYAELLEK